MNNTQIKNTQNSEIKLNYNSEKQTTQNTVKQNYPGSVTFYNTWPRNEVGLFYNAPEPTLGTTEINFYSWIFLSNSLIYQ